MIETTLRLWLQGREYVTIPELQYGYAKTYPEAKRTLRFAMLKFWVAPKPEGLQYRVNNRNLSRPKPLEPGVNGMEGKLLKFELIEAFIRTYRFDTKEEYDRQARVDMEAIAASDLCSETLKNAVREAAEDIIHDLTLSNIREIYRVLMS